MTAQAHAGHDAEAAATDQAYAQTIAAFRARLIQYRKDQGITHPELAKAMDLHLGRAIGAEECDPRQWRMITLLRYADALGVDLVLDFKPRT